MLLKSALPLFLLSPLLSLSTATPTTYPASSYTTWSPDAAIEKSRLAKISVPLEDGSSIDISRLDLVGSPHERGFASGALLANDIIEFIDVKLNSYFSNELLNLDISSLPLKLQEVLEPIIEKGAEKAPEVFWTAMSFVWEKEKEYVPEAILEEMNGIGEGICAGLTSGDDCNPLEMSMKVKHVNMLPELIRMACTAFGAWGTATPDGRRGGGQAFTSLSFPGFVGVVTGVSEKGIGVSEKVWMTYDKRSIQPGSYDGLADVLVIRNILENSSTRAEAEDYLMNVDRTWSIWLGIGDYESQKFDLVGYKQKSAIVYDDTTINTETGQDYIQDVCYVDKHPQPSHADDLPKLLQGYHGNVTFTAVQDIVQQHETGDLHWAAYDFAKKTMILAIGRIDEEGNYGEDGKVWQAHNRPGVVFDLEDLWNGV
ncbi:hypothetical protein TL16_g04606 [Triparma laevis f. inornata]|uniref:Uncharacterized protein n=1 Tax=Triparma laevis f. inornata TaxID=1714386 RepID=A0A9W7E8Y6_9STRA|nr:hypothetical protein TL16_g04606 [Triparma laevis f. inornata]